MLEMETLGPLTQLSPNTTVAHVETWHLFEAVPRPQNDVDVESRVISKIGSVVS
jgi:hypothetical protein